MKEIIGNRLNKISDLEERKLLKKVLLNVYESVIDYNMHMYDELEKRIYEEINDPLEKFYIYSSLIHISDLDPISDFFHAMDSSDEKKVNQFYNMEEITKNLLEKKEFILTTIFLKCNYLIFEEILQNKKAYKGFIKTDRDIYEINIMLKQNKTYIKIIENLYHIFQLNNTEWKTINCPYAYKFADVILISFPELGNDEQVKEIIIDMGEYEAYKVMNVIPMWNIKNIKLQDKSFPMPAQNRIHFEHILDVGKSGKENGYMLTFDNDEFEYIKRYDDTIAVITFLENQSEWNLIQMEQKSKIKNTKVEYEILSNSRELGFTGRLASMKSMVIRTRGELARILQMYSLKKDLQFYDIEVLEEYKKQKQTVDYNSFIDDNIRIDKYKKILVLKFKAANKEDYLIYDKMSFLVSDIQLLFPEYQCVGELI